MTEQELNNKLVSFTYPEGLEEAAAACFPELPLEQAKAKLIAFVSWIICK